MIFKCGQHKYAFNFSIYDCYYMRHHVCALDIPNEKYKPLPDDYHYCRVIKKTIENYSKMEEFSTLLKDQGALEITVKSCGHIMTNHQHRLCILAHMNKTIDIPVESFYRCTFPCDLCRDEYTGLIYDAVKKQYTITRIPILFRVKRKLKEIYTYKIRGQSEI